MNKIIYAVVLMFFAFNAVAQVTVTDKESDSSITFGFGGSTNQQGKSISDDDLSTFKKGVTTYNEVIAKLGKPTSVQNAKGKKIVTYMSQKGEVKVDPIKYVPIIGSLMGGVKNEQTTQMVGFMFDDKDILVDFGSNSTTGTAEDKGLLDKLKNMDIKTGK